MATSLLEICFLEYTHICTLKILSHCTTTCNIEHVVSHVLLTCIFDCLLHDSAGIAKLCCFLIYSQSISELSKCGVQLFHCKVIRAGLSIRASMQENQTIYLYFVACEKHEQRLRRLVRVCVKRFL